MDVSALVPLSLDHDSMSDTKSPRSSSFPRTLSSPSFSKSCLTYPHSFILEGIATVAVGACVKFVLPDAPRECTFLTEREKTIIERRIQEDAGTKEGENDHNDKLSFKAIWSIFSDWKIWLWGIIVSGQTISYYAFSFFAPTIVKELGYKSWQAQLLMVPIYLLACIATVIVGLTADRKQTRWVFIVVPYLVAGIAFVALLSIPHPKLPGLTYGFLFLIPLGREYDDHRPNLQFADTIPQSRPASSVSSPGSPTTSRPRGGKQWALPGSAVSPTWAALSVRTSTFNSKHHGTGSALALAWVYWRLRSLQRLRSG